MCFDIDVTSLNMQELRDTLARISRLLEQPGVVRNLPDDGHQLRQTKLNLEKEIEFRENLEKTHSQMNKLSIRCNSEANIATTHSSKICGLAKKPAQQRFKPHLSLRSMPSGRTESMKELHSGTKMLDLATSMSLQKEQDERVKTAQVQAKQQRLMTCAQGNGLDDDDDSDNGASEYNLSDYFTDDEDESGKGKAKSAHGQPGTSQVQEEEQEMEVAESEEMVEPSDATEVKKEPEEEQEEEFAESEKKVEPSGATEVKKEPKKEQEEELAESEEKVKPSVSTEGKKEPEEEQEEFDVD